MSTRLETALTARLVPLRNETAQQARELIDSLIAAYADHIANERVKAALNALPRTNILAGLPAEATTVILVEDIEEAIAELSEAIPGEES